MRHGAQHDHNHSNLHTVQETSVSLSHSRYITSQASTPSLSAVPRVLLLPSPLISRSHTVNTTLSPVCGKIIIRISHLNFEGWHVTDDSSQCTSLVQEEESTPSPSSSLPASSTPKSLGYSLGGNYLSKWVSKQPEDSITSVPTPTSFSLPPQNPNEPPLDTNGHTC